jgi:hypothetical protein
MNVLMMMMPFNCSFRNKNEHKCIVQKINTLHEDQKSKKESARNKPKEYKVVALKNPHESNVKQEPASTNVDKGDINDVLVDNNLSETESEDEPNAEGTVNNSPKSLLGREAFCTNTGLFLPLQVHLVEHHHSIVPDQHATPDILIYCPERALFTWNASQLRQLPLRKQGVCFSRTFVHLFYRASLCC